jgi:queuosine precursor transporter
MQMTQIKHPSGQKRYRYYELIMAAFITLLLCSNLIGSTKICQFGPLTFGGTLIFFPITYLFGDILTEVYGYDRSRKVVWSGFAALIFACFVSRLMISLPGAPTWEHQEALEAIFNQTPRLVGSSLLAYFFGEFSNSFVLAKMKIWTQGRWLWTRVLGSTLVGEGVDSLLFFPLAFYGTWQNDTLFRVMITSYFVKVIWETLMMPFTYRFVSWLKRVENEDYYDYETRFSPFAFKVEPVRTET